MGETWHDSSVDRWSKDEGHKSSFCLTDGHLSFEKCLVGGKAPEVQRPSCTRRWRCERWFWILCSIYRTRIISITNDGSKSHGYHIQIVRVRRTSSWRDSSTTTQVAKIMVQYGRPSRSFWTESVQSPFGRTVMGKAIWENPIEKRLGESFQSGMHIRTPWKRIILICACGWHQIGWKGTKH